MKNVFKFVFVCTLFLSTSQLFAQEARQLEAENKVVDISETEVDGGGGFGSIGFPMSGGGSVSGGIGDSVDIPIKMPGLAEGESIIIPGEVISGGIVKPKRDHRRIRITRDRKRRQANATITDASILMWQYNLKLSQLEDKDFDLKDLAMIQKALGSMQQTVHKLRKEKFRDAKPIFPIAFEKCKIDPKFDQAECEGKIYQVRVPKQGGQQPVQAGGGFGTSMVEDLNRELASHAQVEVIADHQAAQVSTETGADAD